MADILGFSRGYVPPALLSPEQTLANASSTLEDSIFRTKGSTKEEKNATEKALPDDLAEWRDTILTEGYAQHPIVKPATNTPADFYRRGKPKEGTDPNSTKSGAGYDLIPRQLDDSEEAAPASIRMLGKKTQNSNGDDVDLIPPYSKFFIESVQEGHTERSQIVETFGDFYVFFFGERPPIYTYTGTLINAKSINWAEDWMFFYDNFLRGTKCVELNARLLLTYGYRQVEGFLLSTSTATQAMNEKGVQLQFQVLVIDRKIWRLSLDFGLIESNGTFNTDKSFLTLLTKGLSETDVSDASGQVKKVVNGKQNASSTSLLSAGSLSDITIKFGVPALPNGRGGLHL